MGASVRTSLIRNVDWNPPLIEAPYRPVVHLLDRVVGNPADRLLRRRGAVNSGEMRRNLAGGQAFGIQRQHHLADALQPPRALLCDLRFKRRRAIPRHIELDSSGGV